MRFHGRNGRRLLTVATLGALGTGLAAAPALAAGSYPVPRSATGIGQGVNGDAAIADVEPRLQAAILADGTDCVNWSVSYQQVWLGNGWVVLRVTLSADCAT